MAPEIRNASEIVEALDAEYPPLLREAGIGGDLVVWFHIDETGTLRDVRVKESSGHEALDRAALAVARRFRFTPARNEGDPVPVWIQIPVTFQPD